MGCGGSKVMRRRQSLRFQAEHIDAGIPKYASLFPVAELMNDGTIKLKGVFKIFNPNSLPDPSCLKGKMTPQEYCEAIDYIKKCTAHAIVGLSMMNAEAEQTRFDQLRTQALMAAIEQINERYPSVHFTSEETDEQIQMDFSKSMSPDLLRLLENKSLIRSLPVTALYISVN